MRPLITTLTLLIVLTIESKDFKEKKVIEIVNFTDTMNIEVFDNTNNRLFRKSKSFYTNIEMIHASKFDGQNELQTTWFHSNLGFRVYEYEYKTEAIYKYEYKLPEKVLYDKSFIRSINTRQQIWASKEFLNVYQNKYKRIKEIEFLRNGFPYKCAHFNSKGDTSRIEYYEYENGNRIKMIRGSEKYKQTTYYKFDVNNNELGWIRTVGQDTTVVFINEFKGNLRSKQLEYSRGVLKTIKVFNYDSLNLSEELTYQANGTLKRRKSYSYNGDNLLVKQSDEFGTHKFHYEYK